jgi:hypothetical protein
MSAFIKHKDKLLQGIADGLAEERCYRVPSGGIEVVFQTDDGTRYRFGLAQALDALASDITWDERGNWSEAQIATVEVL